jgi:folate-dependent phosphoribosylglycinamide formyltransferase PurN
MANDSFRVLMLCGKDRFSKIMYNGLSEDFDIVRVIVEDKPSAKLLLKRRLKNLGLINVFGQVLFMVLNKFIASKSENRIIQLISEYGLSEQDFPVDRLQQQETINCDETVKAIQELQPDAIVVNGTRIISKEVLACTEVPFINTHMGITPKYRGVHGGYWALASEDKENCGVTVHLVDEGIDTGGVLYQDIISAGPQDNFNIYPIHQIAKAGPLMVSALGDVRHNRLKDTVGVSPSGLWYHPTLLKYAMTWAAKGIK